MTRRNAWLGNFDDTFGRLRQEMDTVFDRVFGHDGGFTPQVARGFPGAAWEDDEHFYLELDLPGVSQDDLEVTVDNGLLTVRGERKDVEGRGYLYNGRAFGRFERTFSLPTTVGSDEVQATLQAGVLRVALKKAAAARPKRIAVEVK